MKYPNIREEELKNKVASDYFGNFDTTKIIGNVDFCVVNHNSDNQIFEMQSLLWAEAKRGKSDIIKSIVQLILTIGKARTFDKALPPSFLGAFDSDQIAFLGYNDIHEVFYQNDFNWNVTPSNHTTKEFIQLEQMVTGTIERSSLKFTFGVDDVEINQFIKDNLVLGKSNTSKIKIDKNNFLVIYNKWLTTVKPTISVNWDSIKKKGIIDGDFYLADLLSSQNKTLKEKLFVLLKSDHYEFDRNLDDDGIFSHRTINYLDNQKAYNQFWNRYDRPPKQEYWDYIVERRDLLVPQDVRERKGSFFTPQIWVELSQKYLADTLGENWQDEYYIWDCAAGTGNLLAGLTNKYNIYASTLDTQDVDVMRDRIKNGAVLLESHIFQFDFLNDDFSKLPESLQAIIKDPEKRKKLVMYINPPYAEAATANRKGNKEGVSTNKTNLKYQSKIGNATNEMFALFMARIYGEIENAQLALFSKIKYIQGPNFVKFRNFFKSEFRKGFVVPANTFDNVKGSFPIAFLIWDTSSKNYINQVPCDIYNSKLNWEGEKNFIAINKSFINDWYKQHYDNSGVEIGVLNTRGNDFQNQNYIYLSTTNNLNHTNIVTKNNLIPTMVYLAVRQFTEATWLNDRDQFLHPNDGWKSDTEFQNDCLAYSLFHGQNRISSKDGTNHWIPFSEQEVDARDRFESDFMSRFIAGKVAVETTTDEALFEIDTPLIKGAGGLIFSPEATAVFDAGRELWKYYHRQSNCNVNASLYDIREHFQGRNPAGKMNNKSENETYTALIATLRDNLKLLAKKIQPKVYEYGFLRG